MYKKPTKNSAKIIQFLLETSIINKYLSDIFLGLESVQKLLKSCENRAKCIKFGHIHKAFLQGLGKHLRLQCGLYNQPLFKKLSNAGLSVLRYVAKHFLGFQTVYDNTLLVETLM